MYLAIVHSHLPLDSAILFQESILREACTCMKWCNDKVSTELFVRAKDFKQPHCSSMANWLSKLKVMSILKFYEAEREKKTKE